MEELKPCPFCGGKAKVIEAINIVGEKVYAIYCQDCYIANQCANCGTEFERNSEDDIGYEYCPYCGEKMVQDLDKLQERTLLE